MDKLRDFIAGIVAREAATLKAVDDLKHPDRPQPPPDRAQLEADWRCWLTALFPQYCTAEFALHHEEHWDWVWSIEANQSARSRVEIWPRGHAKSTSAELTCVAVGALRSRRYVLYISESQKQADKHIASIESMLGSKAVAKYYPSLGERQLTKYGHSKGWTGSRLTTQSGLVIDGLGLDTCARGVKFEEARPDLIILDDIDSKHDTGATTEKKIEIITTSLLPAGAPYMTVLAIQNLIHRNSIFSRLADESADFLADRELSGPIPALLDFSYQKREGRPGYDITGGVPTWKGAGIEVCQKLLDKIGLLAFLQECQHEVKQTLSGAIYPMWREDVHLISWSQFAARFRVRHIPVHWKLAIGQDWGSSQENEHPCITTWWSKAAANSPIIPYEFRGEKLQYSLAGKAFAYRAMMCIAETPRQVAEKMIAAMKPMNEWDRVQYAVMSHEQKAVRDTYRVHHNLSFENFTPDRLGGIAQMQDYLEIDRTKPHPFKEDRIAADGLWELGCPGAFYIVDDDQLENPIDDRGFARHRAEYLSYHWDIPAPGEAINRIAPYAFFNDAMDSDRMVAAVFFPSIAPLTEEEKFEQSLPESLRLPAPDDLEKLSPEEKQGLYQGRRFAQCRYERQQKSKNSLWWIYQRRGNSRK